MPLSNYNCNTPPAATSTNNNPFFSLSAKALVRAKNELQKLLNQYAIVIQRNKQTYKPLTKVRENHSCTLAERKQLESLIGSQQLIIDSLQG